MSPQMWGTSHNGLISYLSLTQNKLQEVLALMRNHFFISESISIATGFSENPEAIRELDELIINAAMDGVSLIATENSTERVIGCFINTINVKKESQGIFEKCQYKHPVTKTFIEANNEIIKAMNAFDLLQTNCYFEAIFGVTLPEYQGKGIANKLNDFSFEMIQRLVNGDNVKVSLNGEPLPLHPIPTVMLLIVTPKTKIVAEKLGYTEVIEIDFRQLRNSLLPTSIIEKIPIIWGMSKYLK